MERGEGEGIHQPEWWRILWWEILPDISLALAELFLSIKFLEDKWVETNIYFYDSSKFETCKTLKVREEDLLGLWVNPWIVVGSGERILHKDMIWRLIMVNLTFREKIFLEICDYCDLVEQIEEFLSRSPSRIILQTSWNWTYTLLFQNRKPRWN